MSRFFLLLLLAGVLLSLAWWGPKVWFSPLHPVCTHYVMPGRKEAELSGNDSPLETKHGELHM